MGFLQTTYKTLLPKESVRIEQAFDHNTIVGELQWQIDDFGYGYVTRLEANPGIGRELLARVFDFLGGVDAYSLHPDGKLCEGCAYRNGIPVARSVNFEYNRCVTWLPSVMESFNATYLGIGDPL